MNLNPLSFALSQITYLVENLNKKNFKSSQSEIQSLIDLHGFEAERHLLRSLIASIDFNSADNAKSSLLSSAATSTSANTATPASTQSSTTGKYSHQIQLLREFFIVSFNRPNFSSLIQFSFESCAQKFQPNVLSQMSKLLKLSHLQEIVLALTLKNTSREEVRQSALALLKQKLPELLNSAGSNEPLNLGELSLDLVQEILSELKGLASKNTELNSEPLTKLIKELSITELLSSLLNPNNSNKSELELIDMTHIKSLKMDNSLVDYVQELGYGFTASQEECRNALLNYSASIKDVVNPASVARVLSMMARTHNESISDLTGKETAASISWNSEVLVMALQELTPNLQWKDVVKELDHPEFLIKDKSALRLVINGVKRAIRADQFPIEHVYRTWSNPEGQLSLIIHSIKHPDVFCLSEYPCKKTSTECLKLQPEDDNKVITSWRSLNLLELLLNMSELGVYTSCMELIKFPVMHCPDLLLLGLLQLTNIWNKLKQEVLTVLIPIFLGNHPNSAVILQYAWNQTHNTHLIRTLVMSSMVEWYSKAQDAEQNIRLARILDVSQDLKALSILLGGQPMIFNIDLACLAARRGYLKLDKWLTDRIRDHGELFISTVVAFLKRKVPQLNPGGAPKEPSPQMPLLPETVQTILKCIGASANVVTTDLSQEIVAMIFQARQVLEKPALQAQQQQQALKKPPGVGPNFASQANLLLNNPLIDQNKLNVLNSLINQPGRSISYGQQQQQQQQQQQPVQSNLRLNSPQIASDMSGSGGDYSKEIEEEVEKCIQGLFKSTPGGQGLSVDEFISILAKFKESPEKKDKDFYNYALKYIIEGVSCLYGLDEMQFHIMSTVWGLLVDRDVLSSQMLNNCLKMLIQLMSKSIDSRFYIFALKVLDMCKNKLKDYANFSQCLMQLPTYQALPRLLKEYVEYGARGLLPPGSPATFAQISSVTPPISSNQTMQMLNTNPLLNPNANLKPSIANTTNIDTLLVANDSDMANKPPVPPPELVQDKVGFIFNNLSLSNMQIKSDELRDVIKEDHWEWLAHYLVVKRVSIEPNFHTLYSQFIDTLKKELLNSFILAETFRSIKILLRSDKNDQKFHDRALLKNLGSWLGLVTLTKNKPILHRDIDLKSLIIEAFQKGQAELLFVVPFVAKVLESAGKSKIFMPPNPWLFSILSVLVELHNEPDLKLNHKFEIEVLCKNLSLTINEISIKGSLRNYEICDEQLTKRKDPSSNVAVAAAPQVKTSSEPKRDTSSMMPPVPSAAPAAQAQAAPSQTQNASAATAASSGSGAFTTPTPTPKYKINDIKIQSLQSNSNLIFISNEVALLNALPALKTCVIPALEKAVNEIMHLLLEKVVKISVSTAEPLIKKDFSLDPDENHMRLAARNMVANISSGMMLITGKEPLTSHLFNALKAQFTQPLEAPLANAYKDLIAQACTTIVADNVELCMCYLQKFAIQKSIIELEKKLQNEFEARQRSRAEGRVHYEVSVFNYHNEKMPEMLKLRVGSVSPQQFLVYEEFGKNLPGFKVNAEERITPSNLNQIAEEMNVHYDTAIASLKNEIALMPAQHFLSANIQNLIHLIHEFKVTQQPQSAYNLVKKLVFNLLEGFYLMPSEVSQDPVFGKYRESNLVVLRVVLNDQRFCTGNWICKEVQKIWSECTQDFKYSVEGIAVLLKYKLLTASSVDSDLAQFIESGSAKALPFALQFLKYFYIESANLMVDTQFTVSMESINKASCFAQQNSEIRDVLEVIRMNYETEVNNRICATALSMMYTGVRQAKELDDPAGLKEKSEQLLHDWVQYCAVSPQKENMKVFQQFVLQMNTQGLFKTDEMITRFLRICTQICVDSCYFYLSKGQRQPCYQRLDAFMRLIILLVKHSGDQTNHVNKINLFNKVLGLIAGCLLYDHETRGAQFDPMPFHRLFSMLQLEATLPENNLEPISNDILYAFTNVYNVIRPTKAAGFAFAWLELVSNRIFISKMLQVRLFHLFLIKSKIL